MSNGTTTLTYETGGTFINAEETEWHLIEDKLTEVNGEKVEGKILKGALILQTSNDAQNWITELVNANLAGDTTEFKSDFYNTPEIQLLNGCYYRVIVAYEVERKVDEKQYSILNHEVYSQDQNEQKRLVEVYEFYLKDTSEAVIAAGAHPNTKKVVGDFSNVTNTGKDNGFSGHNAITEGKDPHYGWSLGEFRINGYTNTADYQGEEFFLKNLGDAITLTFTLKQDISCLNGNSSLSIAEDKNGSDQYFQIPKTDFKHGALIIRHTDFSVISRTPSFIRIIWLLMRELVLIHECSSLRKVIMRWLWTMRLRIVQGLIVIQTIECFSHLRSVMGTTWYTLLIIQRKAS